MNPTHPSSSDNGKRKVALVLSGGGSKGAYSVGVVNALCDLGIHPDIVCGTSSGALSAAMVVAGEERKLLEIWEHLTTEQVYSRMWKMSFIASFFGNFTYPYFSSKPLLDLIRNSVNFDKVRTSSKKLIVSAFDLVTGRVFRFYNDSPHLDLCLLASASIPVIFPPVRVDDHVLVDGGVTDNVPFKTAIESGATQIYAAINSRREDFANKKIRNNLALTITLLEASQYAILLDDAHHLNRINSLYPRGELHPVEMILLQPSKSLELGTLEFSNSYKLKRAIELGYEDTLKLLSRNANESEQRAQSPSLKAGLASQST
ncbi:MAG TPA: patatin-like phospholipase family protein [Nitrospiria bacterium]|nr:patatin-like phospholipase family protein [Nitrospiria bacterium]